MTELHGLINQLIEIICKTLKLDTQQRASVIESFSVPRLSSTEFPLEHVKQNLIRQTPEENPDRALLLLLLKTVELIHPLTSTNTLFNPTQTAQIHTSLVNIITTLNALFTAPQNEMPRTSSGTMLNSFIVDETYTDVAELISNHFSHLLQIAHRSPEDLPQKITNIIDEYQKIVEPGFLRAENHRLQEENKRLQTLSAEQEQIIERLTAQYMSETGRLPTRGNEQQRQTNPTPTKKIDEEFFGIVGAIKNLGILADTSSRRSTAFHSAMRAIDEANASLTITNAAVAPQKNSYRYRT